MTDFNDERPLNRMLALGPATLTDAELLSFFVSGRHHNDPIRAAHQQLQKFGSLHRVLTMSREDAQRVGINNLEYARLLATMEMSRRVMLYESRQYDALTSPAMVRGYLRLLLQDVPHEVVYIVYLNTKNYVISAEELFRGTLNESHIYPREVVKHAVLNNAASIIIAHNHPSGDVEPSNGDRAMTRILVDALALVEVKVLDHFIVASGAIMSFAERGLI